MCKMGPKNFAFEYPDIVDLKCGGCDKGAVAALIGEGALINQRRFAFHLRDVRLESLQSVTIDHRSDVSGQQTGVFDGELGHGPGQHVGQFVSDVGLDVQHPQGRAALAGALKGRRHDIRGHLFGQRGGVHNHRVLTTGLGDERHDGSIFGGQGLMDFFLQLPSSR